jgi:hypothetical protein
VSKLASVNEVWGPFFFKSEQKRNDTRGGGELQSQRGAGFPACEFSWSDLGTLESPTKVNGCYGGQIFLDREIVEIYDKTSIEEPLLERGDNAT